MYSLRYWYEKKHEDGKVIRLEIHKKNNSAAAMEIGDVVQELSLNIDGGEDNIDAPIVSTSLVMTFVDAYDHEDAKAKKCGNWAEFYTPDATLWKVVLMCKDAGASAFRTLWGGYVTPDSYEEDLTYRGSVTIIARDNIGHLADFLFDAEGDTYGTISLRELIEAAWAKIESPMFLTWGDTWLECNGVSAPDTRMNVAAFAEKNWRETVEMALYGYGAILRYVGENKVNICPLEGLPSFGASETKVIEPIFMTGATRMLTPAIKRIEESASYELEEGADIPQVKITDFSGKTGTYRCKIDGIEIDGQSFGTLEHDAPIWEVATPLGGFPNWIGGDVTFSLFFNNKAYEVDYFAKYRGLEDEIMRYMYLAANNVDTRAAMVYKRMECADFVIHFVFGKPVSLNVNQALSQVGMFNLKRIRYTVGITQNGITQYYTKSKDWASSVSELIYEADATNETTEVLLPILVGEYVGEAEFTLTIRCIEYVQTGYAGGKNTGLYACIQRLSFDLPEDKSLLSKNSVITNYDERNNVVITRDPAIAPAYDTVFLPSIIKNGILVRNGFSYRPASAWSWKGQEAQQLAVFNHLQLLCYHAKPNNIIEGNIVNADVTCFAQIWNWEGKEHILIAGRYNFLRGYIEGAILREFARYDEMWGGLPSSQFPATEAASITNKEADAQGESTSNAPTYTNTTTVNIGTGGGVGAATLNDLQDVDTKDVTSGSVLYYDGSQWIDKSLALLLADFPTKKTQIVAGKGLTGGGTIEEDRTLNVESASDGILVNDDNIKLNIVNSLTSTSVTRPLSAAQGKALSERLAFFEDIFYKTTDGQAIGTRYNLFSEKEISANGLSVGEGGSGGGLISQVYGTTAFGTIMSESNSATFNAYAIDSLYKRIVFLEGKATAVSFVPALTSGKQIGTLSIDGVSTVLYGVDAYSKAEADSTFLKLSGGTISNGNFNPLTIKGNSTYSGIGFVRGTNSAGYLVYEGGANWSVTSENWAAGYKLIHSGNYNSYAPKLDGTGATGTWRIDISGTARYLKTSAFTAVNANELTYTNCALRYISALAGSSTNLPATTSYQNAILTLSLHDNGSTAQLYFTKGVENFYYRSQHTGDWKTVAFIDSTVDKAKAVVDSNGNALTLIHSGNIGSQNAGGLVGQYVLDINNASANKVFSSGFQPANRPSENYATGWTLYNDELKYTYQLAYNTNGSLYSRYKNTSAWSDWKTIAFTDSNVASATKLATARTIWGQSFDGSGNVSGTLYDVNNIYPNSAAERYIGTSSNPFKYMYAEWYGAGTGQTLSFGANNATHIWVDTSGRVGIGTTSPQSRLDVNGDINLNNRIYTPCVFWGRDEEGLYMTTNSISWHNSSNNYKSGLFGFKYNEIIAHQSITANSGVKVASGQALTFLDASGKEHKLTYDSTAGAFKFDGNLYATGEVSGNGLHTN